MAALTRRARQLVLLALCGLGLVLAARWAIPQAPPVYEGAFIPPPYQYCSPPANLKSSNKPPSGGEGDLQVTNGMNKLGTVETADRQVVAFFAQGVFKLNTPLHVAIDPLCQSPPPPPPHSTLVGNVYRIQASFIGAASAASPPPLQISAQVLLRVPPVPYNTVRVYYDAAWHDTSFSAQTDLVNLSLNHLGDFAALNDSSLKTPARAPSTFSYSAVLQVALVVVAALIIAAGIITQRRRTLAGKG